MDPLSYFNEKETKLRTLDCEDVRNTHNFLKSVLIERFVPHGSHIIDLGCGQGGDVLKFKRRRPKSYTGIDISCTAIKSISTRMKRVSFPGQVKLQCMDFTTNEWMSNETANVVSAQFSIQYCFFEPSVAKATIASVGKTLVKGGVLIGTLPLYEAETGQQVSAKLPGDEREFLEYSVQENDFVGLCFEHNLVKELWETFPEFYESSCSTYPTLRTKMKASIPPSPMNAVFAFRKIS